MWIDYPAFTQFFRGYYYFCPFYQDFFFRRGSALGAPFIMVYSEMRYISLIVELDRCIESLFKWALASTEK